MNKTLVSILICTIATLAPVYAGTPIDGKTIIVKLDEQQKFKTDIHSKVKLTQTKTGQGTKLIEMEYFRRDSDASFLICMQAPESDRGNGYLRTGDNMWMYRRNTRTFQHINRDESIGGSDAKADDFETRKLDETYAPSLKDGKELLSEEMLGKMPAYKIEVHAIVNDVDYPKKIWWVSRDNNLLLKEEAYSSNGTLMQTGYYFKYTQINSRYVPIQQLFVDEFEKGNRTVVELSEIKTDKLDNAIFTKAYLEAQSK